MAPETAGVLLTEAGEGDRLEGDVRVWPYGTQSEGLDDIEPVHMERTFIHCVSVMEVIVIS
jgi:hypothetical protein